MNEPVSTQFKHTGGNNNKSYIVLLRSACSSVWVCYWHKTYRHTMFLLENKSNWRCFRFNERPRKNIEE